MQKRRLGKIGYMATIVALGSLAVGWKKLSKKEIDDTMKVVIDHGINYFDVAPSYEDAEVHIAPWIKEYRSSLFIADKTTQRKKEGAWEELNASLRRTGAEYFDLYQLHAVNTMEDLNTALGEGGAIEAFEEAKEKGLIKHIGITGHANMNVLAEALRRYPFETVLLPVNFVIYFHMSDSSDFRKVLNLALEKDLGVIAIKSIAKTRWASENHAYNPWYEPFDDQDTIDKAFKFTLSQVGVTTYATASDHRLVPKIIDAAERFNIIAPDELEDLRKIADGLTPIFPEPA
ncbi:MAG TPA: aldo/keto reductase [Thermoprotei archaeon]|nr:aldo/keto reductase [TACK group archaeon]HEV51019.1 aldo/keto reductase [Thermoprotei archaeon]